MRNIIDAMLLLENVHTGSPVDEDAIARAEKILGVTFADDYRKYLRTFGSYSANCVTLTGITSVVRLMTTYERDKHETIPEGMYIIERLADKDMLVLQNSSGDVFVYSNLIGPRKIANCLADYICPLA